MSKKWVKKENTIEPTSCLWRELFIKTRLPQNGTIIEVAPGYEPKIGNALALLGFRGTFFLIEPDRKAARHIRDIYRRILPQAKIKTVIKPLQNVMAGTDVPRGADAMVASHPFDDMVISFIVRRPRFFSQEKESGARLSRSIKKIYAAIEDKDYAYGIKTTIAAWEDFIESSKPNYFIASQYPSHTLTIKGLTKRQNSGFRVLKQLKSFYKNSLIKKHQEYVFDYKGDPRGWIVAKKPN